MTIIDTPEGIQAYRYIATVRGLRMEIDMCKKYGCPPTALPTRGMALSSAKRILIEEGKWKPTPRKSATGAKLRSYTYLTRKKALTLMEELCKEKGLNVG